MTDKSNHLKALEELNGRLPKGITASATWYGPKLVITYQVRFMLDGERVNLGTFVDLLAAIRAMVEYKATKLYKVAQSELKKREWLIIKGAEEAALSGVQDQQEILTTEKSAMMFCATSVLHPKKLTGAEDIDFLWDEKFGGDGKMYRITPKMLRAYYDSVERAAKEERIRKEQNEFLQSSQPAAAQQPANTESDNSELSDEEYNKLMGLSD